MTFQSIRSRFLGTLVAGLSFTTLCSFEQARADNSPDDLASVGLTVHWEANVGGAPLANGSQSFVLWSHTTEKLEYVNVRFSPTQNSRVAIKNGITKLGIPSGTIGSVTKVISEGSRFEVEFSDSNGKSIGATVMDAKDVSPIDTRIIERIRGEQIDQKKLEQSIINGEKLSKPPRLGLEGATAKAQKLVATYKTLGRKVDIEPFSQRIVYAVTLTTNGILESIDAESGAVLWRTEVGKSTLPMFGPGVSDDYVVVTNGNVFYVYELATGNVVTSRSLAFTPTSCPTVLGDKVIVPSVDGRLIAYDIKKPEVAPGIIRTGTENRLGVVISADRQFFAWPTGSRLIQAKMDKLPVLWNAVGLHESILSLPIATQSGFLASTELGTVFHCSTGREDSLFWKTRLAVQVTQPPLANKELAFIVSDEGNLFALRMQDGSDAWGHHPGNIQNMIAVGKKHLYVKDSRNSLVAIDLATGLESGRSNVILPTVVPNKITDRLIFVTKQGQVTCLREIDASVPSFMTEMNVEATNAPVTPKKTEEQSSAKMDDDSNVFEGAGSTTTPGDDPFKIE
jgi:outer membrane protein assembly factor BamB